MATKHIHIYFEPRKRVQDRAPGSVPPSGLKALVEALHEALAAREKGTKDAGFDESKVKRDEGGKFSAQQHMDAAADHKAKAAAHSASGTPGDMQASGAHTAAADAHEMAAKHANAQTGWQAHSAMTAHNATALAKGASAKAAGPASLDQLKATASNPKASVEERAAAVGQLDKMEKAANAVAASPHAIPKPPGTSQFNAANISPEMKAKLAALAPKIAGQQQPKTGESGAGMNAPALPDKTGKPQPPHTAQAQKEWESKSLPQAAAKPTAAVNTSSTKAATHELLSSGHPFSIDELMKATGAKSTSTLMTALSDLKSEKYAGKLGKLNIVKRPDGMYHVQGATQTGSGEPAGKPPAANKATSGPPAKKLPFSEQPGVAAWQKKLSDQVTAEVTAHNAKALFASSSGKSNAQLANEDASPKNYMDDLPTKKPNLTDQIKQVAQSNAAPEHKEAAIKALQAAGTTTKPAEPSGDDAAVREEAHQTAISKYSSGSKNMPPAVKARHQELLAKVPTANLVANPHYEHAQAEKQARLDVFRKSLPGGKLPLPQHGPSTPNAGSPAAKAANPHEIAPGKSVSPAMAHHGAMQEQHRDSAAGELVKNGNTSAYRDHMRAAQMHANALSEAKNKATGYGGHGFDESAKSANEKSKHLKATSGDKK